MDIISIKEFRKQKENLAYKSKIEEINELIKKGIDINKQYNEKGYTRLMWAIRDNDIDMVRALIDKGADINIQDTSGNTALIYTVSYKRVEIIKLLVKAGADIYIENTQGIHAVDIAENLTDNSIKRKILYHLRKNIPTWDTVSIEPKIFDNEEEFKTFIDTDIKKETWHFSTWYYNLDKNKISRNKDIVNSWIKNHNKVLCSKDFLHLGYYGSNNNPSGKVQYYAMDIEYIENRRIRKKLI